MIRVVPSNIVKAAPIFRRLVSGLGIDTFTDTRYYPPPTANDEDVARYFIFMVAIDHRTSRFGPFEGVINGEFFHGADALYRLGMKAFSENPGFFDPRNMSKITAEDVKKWLRLEREDGTVKVIWDPEVRAELLRDLGSKLLKYYGGSVLNLLRSSGNMLRGSSSLGLIPRLKAFKAYSDPVEKKSFLFVKFISRRGLFTYIDREEAEVPVDNHLTRIALRLGLVEVSDEIKDKIVRRVPFSEDEDVALRLVVREAYKLLSKVAGLDPLILDDVLWMFGRKCCTYVNPVCEGSKGHRILCSSKCPFQEICPSASESIKLTEHEFRDTYYY